MRSRLAEMTCAVVVLVAITLCARPVRADNVSELLAQLNDDSDKVRLSAAAALGHLESHDTKVIFALVKHVSANNESSSSVRQAAAFALAKSVDASVSPSIKKLAVASLQKAQTDDDEPAVRTQAGKSLAALGAGGSGATANTNNGPQAPTGPASSAGGVYVNIGPMSSKTGGADDKKLQAQMVSVATQVMGQAAPTYVTTWAGGAPSKSALAAKQMAGFYVDGTLNTVDVKEAGSTATVSCKVSMLLASFPDKSVFGFLNGGASVQGSTSPRDEALARGDCVQAVVEDLIRKKIIPTIKSKASP